MHPYIFPISMKSFYYLLLNLNLAMEINESFCGNSEGTDAMQW